MRLLIAMDDRREAESLQRKLYAAEESWKADIVGDGEGNAELFRANRFDVMISAGETGRQVEDLLEKELPLCPPRVLRLKEENERPGEAADCAVLHGVSKEGIAALCAQLMKKTLPRLAAKHEENISKAVEVFLEELGMDRRWKGRAYLAFCLGRTIPSELASKAPMKQSYAACAKHFRTTPAAVERCVRVAVENVFTMGNIRGIEKHFGSSIDPERGKPTNRIFLLHSTQKLRSFLDGGAFREEQ